MSKIKGLSKDIPETSHEFTIEVEGEVTKKRFIGDFVCKVPRRKELCLIDKHRAFLNGPLVDQLSPDTLRFHHMVSYLRYTLVDSDCPKWWKEADLGYELYDENVVKAVYDEVLNFETSWIEQVWGKDAVKALQKKRDGQEDESVEESEGE